MPTYPDLAGKIALVTGSTSGLGLEAARKLTENGAIVYINGRTVDGVAKAMNEIGGQNCRPAACDVSDYAQVHELVDRIVHENGSMDILINNADSHNRLSFFAETSAEDWRNSVDVALWGQLNCAHVAIQHMIPRERGVLLNVSGGSADEGVAGYAVPGAVKGAIAAFTMHLAKEMLWHGIRVNGITPHIVDTAALRQAAEGVAGTELERRSTGAWEAEAPIPVASPADAAEAYVFLCSDASSYICGEIVKLNGGRIIAR